MIKTIHSRTALSLLALFAIGLAVFAPAAARAQEDPFGLNEAKRVNVGQSTDLKQDIAQVINVLLGFLGILAVIIILYAGFKWMTASGNEEQVGEARKMLLQAVIGLVIVMMAWVITNFVVSRVGGVLEQPGTAQTTG
ncbi:MAG: hypothetical protein HYW81_03020 [Parcubacteria group bacterium]|nr:hypothetical protein [Parcubacteria group bacterium]